MGQPGLVPLFLLVLLTQATNAFQTPRYTPAPLPRPSGDLSPLRRAKRGSSSGPSRSRLHLDLQCRFPHKEGVSSNLVLHMTSRDGASEGSEESTDGNDSESKMAKKVAGRKKRVMIGYRLSAAIYALLGLATLIPAFLRPSLAPFALNYAGGPVLAAGIAYILSGAAFNDRLSSETYLRLNLMLSKFGFLWLAAAVLVRQTAPLTKGAKVVSNPLVVLASLSALINGIKGWAYGAKGWDKAKDTTFSSELGNLFKNSLSVLTSPVQNTRAGLYLGATLFAGVFKVLKLVELVQLAGNPEVTAAKLGSWAIAYAKILLLGTSAFTLLDAANRDRLKGTTFIELNVMSSFVWLGTGAYLFHSGQMIQAVLSAIFSSFSLLTGATFYLEKKK